MTSRVTIFHSDKYDLVSYGNGLSYALHDNVNKQSYFTQGDDAIDFRNLFDILSDKEPQRSFDSILDFLISELFVN